MIYLFEVAVLKLITCVSWVSPTNAKITATNVTSAVFPPRRGAKELSLTTDAMKSLKEYKDSGSFKVNR